MLNPVWAIKLKNGIIFSNSSMGGGAEIPPIKLCPKFLMKSIG